MSRPTPCSEPNEVANGGESCSRAPLLPRLAGAGSALRDLSLLVRIHRLMSPRVRAAWQPEDILQDALLTVLRSAQRFESEDARRFAALVLAVARHRILELRRGARERKHPRRRTALPTLMLLLREPSMLDVVEIRTEPAPEVPPERRRSAHVRRRIDDLTRLQKACVVLRYFHGLPWETVGMLTGRTSQAARKACERARCELGRVAVPD